MRRIEIRRVESNGHSGGIVLGSYDDDNVVFTTGNSYGDKRKYVSVSTAGFELFTLREQFSHLLDENGKIANEDIGAWTKHAMRLILESLTPAQFLKIIEEHRADAFAKGVGSAREAMRKALGL